MDKQIVIFRFSAHEVTLKKTNNPAIEKLIAAVQQSASAAATGTA
jgi:hypothetical protein